MLGLAQIVLSEFFVGKFVRPGASHLNHPGLGGSSHQTNASTPGQRTGPIPTAKAASPDPGPFRRDEVAKFMKK